MTAICVSLSAGSSGQFHHSGLTPNTYSLRIVAKDPITDERAILRGDFTVIGDEDEEFCGVTIINTGTEVKNGETEVHFTGVGATKSFKCRMDKERSKPCTLNYDSMTVLYVTMQA